MAQLDVLLLDDNVFDLTYQDIRFLQYYPSRMLELNIPMLTPPSEGFDNDKHKTDYVAFVRHIHFQTTTEQRAYLLDPSSSENIHFMIQNKLAPWLSRNNMTWQSISTPIQLEIIYAYFTWRYFPFPTFATTYELECFFQKYQMPRLYISIFLLASACKQICIENRDSVEYTISNSDCTNYVLSINRLIISDPRLMQTQH
jgi:hypothetical protein